MKRRGTLFDWLPEPKALWFLVLFGVCFVVAAIFYYFPCQTTIFASMYNSC